MFEFSPAKSERNKEKHGIDFVEAQELWKGEILEVPLLFDSERRYLVIGQMQQKHYAAVITYRHGKIRIISVRRARKKEIDQWRRDQPRR